MGSREVDRGVARGPLTAEWASPARWGRLWVAVAAAAVVPATAGAHKYITLPVLVNICGSHDHEVHEGGFESREAYVDAIKTQIAMACKDINLRLLDQPPEGADQDVVLQLGTITWRDLDACPDDVTQDSEALRQLFADGRKELKDRLSDKGVKVNVVNIVREAPEEGETEGRPIAAVGETGPSESVKTPAGGTENVRHGRVVAIDDHTLTFGLEIVEEGSTETELCGTNGEILLHEIGHNSGLVLEHGTGDTNETGFMTTPPTRALNAAQWQMLRRFWERFGEMSANDAQHSFVPRTDDTHHAHVAQPPWATQPPVASLELAIGPTGWLRGRVELAALLPHDGFFTYDVGIVVDADDDIATCGEFFEFGEGYDFLVALAVENYPEAGAPGSGSGRGVVADRGGGASMSGFTLVSGSLSYLSGFQYVSVPIGAVYFSEVGSIGAGSEHAPHASAITFAHDISAFPISPGTVPAKAKLLKSGVSAGFVTVAIQPVLDPTLPSLPATVPAFGPFLVTGEGFAGGSAVSVHIAHLRSFASDPVATGSTDGAGSFSLLVDVVGPRAGDFLVSAVDAEGNLAAGVVTADVPCSLACTAAAPGHGRVGTPVPFDSSVTSIACADPVVVGWSFGDGSPDSSEPEPSHVYPDSGVFPWAFTATSGDASCGSAGSIAVIDPATAVRRKLRHR